MAVLVWKHGKSRNEVRALIQGRLALAGVSDKVIWDGDTFRSSVGWGSILNLVGHITDQTVTLEKSSGAMGGVILEKSREAFRELFPDGQQSDAMIQQ